MMKQLCAGVCVAVTLVSTAQATIASAQSLRSGSSQQAAASAPEIAPPQDRAPSGVTRMKDDPSNPGVEGGAAVGNMTYHGGPVQHVQKVHTIFWQGGSPAFPAGYMGTINQFVQDLNGSPYYAIASQYGDPAGRISTGLVYGGTWLDATNPFPSTALGYTELLAEVNRAKIANGWTSDANTYFQVYTPSGITSTVGGICGLHWFANPAIGQILFPQPGCYPGGPYPNSRDADAAINTSAHEILETVTDPLGNAWYFVDASGEIGDMCNFDFGPRAADGSNTALHGRMYLIQREWSNATSSCVVGFSGSRLDFNGDGMMDLLWQNTFDGYLAAWLMNGANLMSSDLLIPHYVSDTNWKIVGSGDFNGDGKPDIVWQEQTQGWVGIWLMNGLTLLSSTSLLPAARERVSDTNWKIAGVMDLNGDGKPDILWRDQMQGWLAAWMCNGLTVTSSVGLNPERVADTNWEVRANGDMNGDGKSDIIWQNSVTGYIAVWYMNGINVMDSVLTMPQYVSDTRWKIVAAGDFNVDGMTDLVWQEQTQGWIGVWLMNGIRLAGSFAINPERVSDTRWKIVGPK